MLVERIAFGMSLEEAFQEVHGIGEEKAKELVAIAEDNQTDSDAQEQVSKALEYMEEGQYGYAEKFLRRVVE